MSAQQIPLVDNSKEFVLGKCVEPMCLEAHCSFFRPKVGNPEKCKNCDCPDQVHEMICVVVNGIILNEHKKGTKRKMHSNASSNTDSTTEYPTPRFKLRSTSTFFDAIERLQTPGLSSNRIDPNMSNATTLHEDEHEEDIPVYLGSSSSKGTNV